MDQTKYFNKVFIKMALFNLLIKLMSLLDAFLYTPNVILEWPTLAIRITKFEPLREPIRIFLYIAGQYSHIIMSNIIEFQNWRK